MESAGLDKTVTLGMIGYVAAVTFFAWLPFLLGRPFSFWVIKPVLLLTLSSVLQAIFIGLVGTGILLLEDSLKFAALGAPVSIGALVLAGGKKRNPEFSVAVIACPILGLLMWILLITLH